MINVLLIEDSESVTRFIQALLEGKVNLTIANTLAKGISLTSEMDIILLDLELPDSTGLRSLEQLLPQVDIPIIILTATVDEQISIQAIQKGAQDYLIKNDINAVKLWHTILYSIERYNRTNIDARINILASQFNIILEKLDVLSKDIKKLLEPMNGG